MFVLIRFTPYPFVLYYNIFASWSQPSCPGIPLPSPAHFRAVSSIEPRIVTVTVSLVGLLLASLPLDSVGRIGDKSEGTPIIMVFILSYNLHTGNFRSARSNCLVARCPVWVPSPPGPFQGACAILPGFQASAAWPADSAGPRASVCQPCRSPAGPSAGQPENPRARPWVCRGRGLPRWGSPVFPGRRCRRFKYRFKYKISHLHNR